MKPGRNDASQPIQLTHQRAIRPNGFTLPEVMISATVSCFILAAVLSVFLFMGRSGANVQRYNDMEAQSRKALETFAEDTRQANAIVWTSSANLTLTVNGRDVAYYYEPTTTSWYRQVAGETRTALVSNIASFSFQAYNVSGTELLLANSSDLVTANRSTKQLQVSMGVAGQSRILTNASKTVVSARFILRNKKVAT